MGKVKVPAYKDEDEFYAEGLHQGIVSEVLFNKVQDILNKRKRKTKKWSAKDENLPLRGHIICSRCGRPLTGSKSKGKMGVYYHYYHCRNGCKERLRAKDAHDMFDRLLKQVTIDESISELYCDAAKEKLGANQRVRTGKMNKIREEITALKETIEKAEDSLFEGRLDPNTFDRSKARYIKRIADLEFEYSELKNLKKGYMKQIQGALEFLEKLDKLYYKANWEGKQEILSSIFDKKLIFEKNKCRTLEPDPFFESIGLKTSDLENKKTGQTLDLSTLSCPVTQGGFEPPTLRAEI
ncbi:hypothetical protein HN014_10530 [Aquimarina sp. TRL1]|nr:hypothetical protein HN014_10530 [Aquimarina sp. TRL1]